MSYNTTSIAKWFIEKAKEDGKSLTQIQVQKLVYFAHAWHLAFDLGSLIDEPVEAWAYGPVIASLYRELKRNGRTAVEDINNVDSGDYEKLGNNPEAIDVLEQVWGIYGDLPATRLIGLTHVVGDPWEQVYTPNSFNEVIDNDLIKTCFKKKLNKKAS